MLSDPDDISTLGIQYVAKVMVQHSSAIAVPSAVYYMHLWHMTTCSQCSNKF